MPCLPGLFYGCFEIFIALLLHGKELVFLLQSRVAVEAVRHQQKDRAQRDSFVDMVLTNTGYKILHTENFNEAELKEFVS